MGRVLLLRPTHWLCLGIGTLESLLRVPNRSTSVWLSTPLCYGGPRQGTKPTQPLYHLSALQCISHVLETLVLDLGFLEVGTFFWLDGFTALKNLLIKSDALFHGNKPGSLSEHNLPPNLEVLVLKSAFRANLVNWKDLKASNELSLAENILVSTILNYKNRRTPFLATVGVCNRVAIDFPEPMIRLAAATEVSLKSCPLYDSYDTYLTKFP